MSAPNRYVMRNTSDAFARNACAREVARGVEEVMWGMDWVRFKRARRARGRVGGRIRRARCRV